MASRLKIPGDKIQSVLEKLISGIPPKVVSYEEEVSQTFITHLKQKHPLFFWKSNEE